MEEKKQQQQSSKVTNFMRMVGNMSSSVDYRVITALEAPGMENRRVRLKKSTEREETYTSLHGAGAERHKEKQNIHPIIKTKSCVCPQQCSVGPLSFTVCHLNFRYTPFHALSQQKKQQLATEMAVIKDKNKFNETNGFQRK